MIWYIQEHTIQPVNVTGILSIDDQKGFNVLYDLKVQIAIEKYFKQIILKQSSFSFQPVTVN